MGAGRFERVALIGIGLIGSSLARVLRRESPATVIVACARRAETLDTVRRLDLADETTIDPAAAVRRRRLRGDRDAAVGLCRDRQADRPGAASGRDRHRCRLGQGRGDPRLCSRYCRPACISFPAIRSPAPSIPARNPVLPSCSDDRWCILTPLPETAPEAVAKVTALWELAGMRVVTMEAEHHDKVLAMTSHLPHLIAYTIVGTATELGEDLQSEVVAFSAGGFRDFTRIAASDPVMWRDIFLEQSRGGARAAAALQRGSDRACSARSAEARAKRSTNGSPVPARSAARSSRPSRPRPLGSHCERSEAIPRQLGSARRDCSVDPAGLLGMTGKIQSGRIPCTR